MQEDLSIAYWHKVSMYSIPLSESALSSDQPLKIDLLNADKNIFSSAADVLVYLRNLDIQTSDLDLNIKDLSYQQKEDFLLEYMTSDIQLEVKELDSMLLQLLCQFHNIKNENLLMAQLTDEECAKFISAHSEIISLFSNTIYSFMQYVAYACAKKTDIFYQQYCKNDNNKLNLNVMNVFKYAKTFEYDFFLNKQQIVNYDNLFKKALEKMQIVLEHSMLVVLLYGMHTVEWNKFKHLIKKL